MLRSTMDELSTVKRETVRAFHEHGLPFIQWDEATLSLVISCFQMLGQ